MGELKFCCPTASKNKLPEKSARNLLISVPNEARNDYQITKTKELFKYLKKQFVIQDSGGFTVLQEANKGKRITCNPNLPLKISKDSMNIAPAHIIKAAVDLRPNILVALDFPVNKIEDEREQRREFRKKLLYNVKWAIETSRLKEKYCNQIALFLPLQCYTKEDFDEFMKRIHGIRFDGVCLPTRNLGLFQIAQFMTTFYKVGITKVHILGTSYYPTLCLAAYLSNTYFEWISFDSTSWRRAAELHHVFLSPLDLTRIHVDESIPESADKLRKACRCQICKHTSLSDYKSIPPKEKRFLLRTHNLYATEKVTRRLHKHITDLYSLQEYLRFKCKMKDRFEDLLKLLQGEEVLYKSSHTVDKSVRKAA